jgi:hypothetical protein
MKLKIIKLFLVILTIQKAWSAACCGGGANFPSLILNDDAAHLGFSASATKTVGDAPQNGKAVFRSSNDKEWVHTFNLDAAVLISDRWQIGGNIPYVHRSRSTSSDSASEWGWGDISTSLGFEYLPEYSYSIWKPRGFLFLQSTLPTGGNVYESDQPFGVDARGKGFYTFSLGTILLKSWRAWDSSFRFAVNKSLDRSFTAADGSEVDVKPGYDIISSLGLGWSPGMGNWRMGLMINPIYTTPSNIGRYKLVWNTSLDVSYLMASKYLLGISYNDQSLLGPAKNTSLDRGLRLFMRLRWQR